MKRFKKFHFDIEINNNIFNFYINRSKDGWIFGIKGSIDIHLTALIKNGKLSYHITDKRDISNPIYVSRDEVSIGEISKMANIDGLDITIIQLDQRISGFAIRNFPLFVRKNLERVSKSIPIESIFDEIERVYYNEKENLKLINIYRDLHKYLFCLLESNNQLLIIIKNEVDNCVIIDYNIFKRIGNVMLDKIGLEQYLSYYFNEILD